MLACGLLQYLSMYGTAVAYVITTAKSMRYSYHVDHIIGYRE